PLLAELSTLSLHDALPIYPRYWKTWFGFGLWWLVSQLPYPVLMALGRLLGEVSYRLLKRRRFIARRNIELCFPELSESERERRVDRKSTRLNSSHVKISYA